MQNIVLQLDDPMIAKLKGMARNISLNKYIEHLIKREIDKENTISDTDMEITPFIESLSVKTISPVPADVNKTSDIIDYKDLW